jgi:hypothetical protein
MKKLRVDCSQGMLSIIHCRIFCLSVCHKNIWVKIYRITIITVPVVLCGCETWSFAVREEHRLRVLEKKGAEENI